MRIHTELLKRFISSVGLGARSIQRKFPVLCGARLTHPTPRSFLKREVVSDQILLNYVSGFFEAGVARFMDHCRRALICSSIVFDKGTMRAVV